MIYFDEAQSRGRETGLRQFQRGGGL